MEEEIIRLFNLDKGYGEIAKILGTTKSSVRHYVSKNNLKRNSDYLCKPVKCESCGKEFMQKTTTQRFCSSICTNKKYRSTHYPKSIKVDNSKEILELHHRGFTSTEIANIVGTSSSTVRSKLKQNGLKLSISRPVRKFVCVNCGKTYHATKGKNKYCSKECRTMWFANNPRHTKECECCGKEFKTNINDQIYCSTKCMGIVNKKKFENEEVVNQYGTREQRENKFKQDFNSLFVGKAIYVNGFTDGDCRFNCKCLKCGAIYSLGAQVVRKKGNAECVVCLEQERLAKRELNIARRNLINTLKKVSRLQIKESKRTQRILDKQNNMKEYECIYCGKKFMSNSNKKYCSKECMKRSNDYHKSSRRREKIRSNGNYDWSISIPKLIKRDKVCKICGKPVDIHDKVNAKGTVMVGGNYPSVDHIIPVSKGGTHTWDNVQLAHVSCNVKKSDTTDVVARVGRVQLSLNV